MVMWTNTHCFDFFFHVILYILSQYVQNYRPSASASILINVIMNINNQDTFLQLYYARNVILGK